MKEYFSYHIAKGCGIQIYTDTMLKYIMLMLKVNNFSILVNKEKKSGFRRYLNQTLAKGTIFYSCTNISRTWWFTLNRKN